MTRWLDPPKVDTSPLLPLNLPPLVKQTLIRRGIRTPESARAFLHADENPSTPFPDIESAVEMIRNAIRRNDRICVWGDFDVDGQTATALLVQTLAAIGANVMYYIPIRAKESHGVHLETLAPIIDDGAKLMITCDTGITAHEATEWAIARGANVIVTDHHDPGVSLPKANAIVNPKLLPEGHPLRDLAGVGVAYKLAEALITNYESRSTPEALLDLVALGLIADVALLQGETRSLTQKGIRQLRTAGRLGLKVMAELSGSTLESLTEETIGFTFAPRLNALGRLSDANPAVEFLLTDDPARAHVIAAQIEGLNAQRRLLTNQVAGAAESMLHDHPDLLTEPAIILSHPHWPGGVVGIVANRLVDRYHKPALLLSESEDGILRGSARSIEGLHITEAITANRELLLGFGGHPMAAGVSLHKDNLSAFRKGLGRAVEKQLGEIARQEPTLQLDAWLELEEVNLELAEAIEMLAPFGAANPPLKLATRNVTLKSVAEIGRTKEHLRLTVQDQKGNLQNILWWGGAGGNLPETGTKLDILYSLRATTFRGQRQASLTFEELRAVDEKPIELPAAKREIVDCRLRPAFALQESAMIWAEGADKSKGKSRFELTEAHELVIYTTPPSPADLRSALERVNPDKIYLAGMSPVTPKTDDFLSQLAGLAKYAMKNKAGKASVRDLAVVTAQRESAVRIGLEWLAAGGHLSVSGENDTLELSAGSGKANQYLQKELFVAVRGILEETGAYRAYFASASVEHIIPK